MESYKFLQTDVHQKIAIVEEVMGRCRAAVGLDSAFIRLTQRTRYRVEFELTDVFQTLLEQRLKFYLCTELKCTIDKVKNGVIIIGIAYYNGSGINLVLDTTGILGAKIAPNETLQFSCDAIINAVRIFVTEIILKDKALGTQEGASQYIRQILEGLKPTLNAAILRNLLYRNYEIPDWPEDRPQHQIEDCTPYVSGPNTSKVLEDMKNMPAFYENVSCEMRIPPNRGNIGWHYKYKSKAVVGQNNTIKRAKKVYDRNKSKHMPYWDKHMAVLQGLDLVGERSLPRTGQLANYFKRMKEGNPTDQDVEKFALHFLFSKYRHPGPFRFLLDPRDRFKVHCRFTFPDMRHNKIIRTNPDDVVFVRPCNQVVDCHNDYELSLYRLIACFVHEICDRKTLRGAHLAFKQLLYDESAAIKTMWHEKSNINPLAVIAMASFFSHFDFSQMDGVFSYQFNACSLRSTQWVSATDVCHYYWRHKFIVREILKHFRVSTKIIEKGYSEEVVKDEMWYQLILANCNLEQYVGTFSYEFDFNRAHELHASFQDERIMDPEEIRYRRQQSTHVIMEEVRRSFRAQLESQTGLPRVEDTVLAKPLEELYRKIKDPRTVVRSVADSVIETVGPLKVEMTHKIEGLDEVITSFKKFIEPFVSQGILSGGLADVVGTIKDLVVSMYDKTFGVYSQLAATIGMPITHKTLKRDVMYLLLLVSVFNYTSNPLVKCGVVTLVLRKLGWYDKIVSAIGVVYGWVSTAFKCETEDTVQDTNFMPGMVDWISGLLSRDNAQVAGIIASVLLVGFVGKDVFTKADYARTLNGVVNMARSTMFLGGGIAGLTTVAVNLVKAFTYVFDWMKKKMKGDSYLSDREKLAQNINELEAVGSAIEMMYCDVAMALIRTKPEVGQRCIHYFEQIHRLHLEALRGNMPREYLPLIRDLLKKARELRNIAYRSRKENAFRPTPFHIQFVGKAGIGKSSLLKIMIANFCAKFFPSLDPSACVYALGLSKHLDGYSGQKIFVADDVFRYKEAEHLTQMILFVSCVPLILPMASLEEKGQFFESEVMITTTNVPYPRCDEILDIEALWRRRHCLIEVECDPDYFDNKTGKLDYAKVEEDFGVDNEFEHLTFNFLTPVVNEDVKNNSAKYIDGEIPPVYAQPGQVPGTKGPLKELNYKEMMDQVYFAFMSHRKNESKFKTDNKVLQRMMNREWQNIRSAVKPDALFRMEEFVIEERFFDVVDADEYIPHFEAVFKAAFQAPEQCGAMIDDNAYLDSIWDKTPDDHIVMNVQDILDHTSDPNVAYRCKVLIETYEASKQTGLESDDDEFVDTSWEEETAERLRREQERRDRILKKAGKVNITRIDKPYDKESPANTRMVNVNGQNHVFVRLPRNDEIVPPLDPHIIMEIEERIAGCTPRRRDIPMSFADISTSGVFKFRASQHAKRSPAFASYDGDIREIELWMAFGSRLMKDGDDWWYDVNHPGEIMSAYKSLADFISTANGVVTIMDKSPYDLTSLDRVFRESCDVFLNLSREQQEYVYEYCTSEYTTIDVLYSNLVYKRRVFKNAFSLISNTLTNWYYNFSIKHPIMVAIMHGLLCTAVLWGSIVGLLKLFAPKQEDTSRVYFKHRNAAPKQARVVETSMQDDRDCLVSRCNKRIAINGSLCNALGVAGCNLLVPKHAIKPYVDRGDPILLEYIPTDNTRVTWDAVVQAEDVIEIPDSDVAIISSRQIPCFRDLRKHFITNDELDKIPSKDIHIQYVSPDRDVRFVSTVPGVNFGSNYDYISKHLGQNHLAHYISVDMKMPVGSSGGIIYSHDPRVRHWILGFQSHTHGGKSFLSVITQETLEKYLPRSSIMSEPCIYLDHEPVDTCSLINSHIQYEGSFDEEYMLGFVGKSKITPSLISSDFESKRIPAILHPFDDRVPEGVHPLQHSINKFGRDKIIEFDSRIMDYTVLQFGEYLKSKIGPLRIYDISDCVLGNENLARVDLTTSMGLPYVWDKFPGKLKGKAQYLSIADTGDEFEIEQEVLDQLDRLIYCYDNDLPSDVTSYDFPKDELRPIEKVLACKTRSINVLPFHVTLLYRMLCGDLEAKLHTIADGTTFYGVGINPESHDWYRLYNSLVTRNDFVYDFDVENWDGHFRRSMFRMIIDLTKMLYRPYLSPQAYSMWEKRLERLYEDMTTLPLLFLNICYRKFLGLPSGFPGTSKDNSLGHILIVLYFYFEHHGIQSPLSNMYSFNYNVFFIVYGDDIVVAIRPESDFNYEQLIQSYNKYCWPVTDAQKSKELKGKPIQEVTFLKRTFGNIDGFWIGKVDREVINDLLYWTRSGSLGEKEQLYSNINDALEFAVAHGEEYYESLRTKINFALKKQGLPTVFMPYISMKNIIMARYFQ